ncbi:MAG: Gfo/Idh/MocA family oxidoreductase [Deltaproteobacteria bacterium]|nr:Gfo/Idh/MocA family oxidoreductase [Deltaproteobacteria bacterium]MBI2501035.1 Gfo/Idh/MocA family oxidoreductase [Deltaproteobacteria bacterium]
MSPQKLKYGLIGCGQAGKVHAWHFSHHPEIQPLFCMDTDRESAHRLRSDLSFKNAYTNLEEALDSEKPDLVSIATPPSEHASQVISAAQRGIQVLCEKPLFLDSGEMKPTLNICFERNVTLGVMLPRRFYNDTLATRAVLAEGLLGRILKVDFDLECRKESSYYKGWRGKKGFAGGGVLMSQAIHSIDQLVFLFGKPSHVEGQVWRVRDSIEIEDEAQGVIFFENGVRVDLRATNNSSNHLWQGVTSIEGDKGRIVLDSEKVVLWDVVAGAARPTPEEIEEIPEVYKPAYYGPGHRKVIHHFINVIQGRESLRVSGEESCESLKIIWDFYSGSSNNLCLSK